MADNPKASKSMGLEINSNELKAACLSYKNRKLLIDKLLSISLDPEHTTSSHVKPLYMKDEEKILQSKTKDSLVVTVLPTKDVLVRQLALQLKKDKEIEAVFEFQAEPLLPYPIDEALVDKITLDKEGETTKLTLTACKTEQISLQLEQWHSIGIEPEVISCTPIAMAAFSEFFHKSDDPFIQINIGHTETTGILIFKGKLAAAQTIGSGINNWIDLIRDDSRCTVEQAAEKIEQLDFADISEIKYPSLYKRLGQFRLEITRLIYALRKQPQGHQAQDILVTGEGAALKGATQTVCSNLQHNLITPERFADYSWTPAHILRYAVAIGAGLTGLPGITNQINFRQKAFAYPNPWKRIKKPIALYIGGCLCLTIAVYMFGEAYLANKEDQLKQNFVEVLSLMKKPYKEFEQDYKIQVHGEPVYSIINLTQNDIKNRLELVEKEIKATPDTFPLYPNIPKVTDVLAWLSTLPVITGENEGKIPETPRIQLESLSYKMVKKPEQTRKMEKYQAKLEIEFSSQTPRYAREFHDFLLAPNAFVDPSGEVKWNSERGKYRASFFLKDKTQYPSSR